MAAAADVSFFSNRVCSLSSLRSCRSFFPKTQAVAVAPAPRARGRRSARDCLARDDEVTTSARAYICPTSLFPQRSLHLTRSLAPAFLLAATTARTAAPPTSAWTTRLPRGRGSRARCSPPRSSFILSGQRCEVGSPASSHRASLIAAPCARLSWPRSSELSVSAPRCYYKGRLKVEQSRPRRNTCTTLSLSPPPPLRLDAARLSSHTLSRPSPRRSGRPLLRPAGLHGPHAADCGKLLLPSVRVNRLCDQEGEQNDRKEPKPATQREREATIVVSVVITGDERGDKGREACLRVDDPSRTSASHLRWV